MSSPTVFDPNTLPKSALAELRVHRAALVEAAGSSSKRGSLALSVCIGPDIVVDLPPALARVVAAMLAEVADGRAVDVRTWAEELTTQEAAELLGVTRPFVVKLIDSGDLPARLVGTHRRLQRRDVLAYREQMRATTAEALQTLTVDAQALGLYDAEQGDTGGLGDS